MFIGINGFIRRMEHIERQEQGEQCYLLTEETEAAQKGLIIR